MTRGTNIENASGKRTLRDTLKTAWPVFRNPSLGDCVVACYSQTFELIEIWWFLTFHEWVAALLVPLICLKDTAEPTWLSYASTSSSFRGRVEKIEYFPRFLLFVLKQAHWARGLSMSIWYAPESQNCLPALRKLTLGLLTAVWLWITTVLYNKLYKDGDGSWNLTGTHFCASFTPNQLGMPTIKKTRRKGISL